MAQGKRALDRAQRAATERSGFGSKAVCFFAGHLEEVWHVDVVYHFGSPIILGGVPVSEIGPIDESWTWCRRCGKIL